MSKRQILAIIASIAIIIAAVLGAFLTNGYGLSKKKQSPLVALPSNHIFYFYGEKISDEIQKLYKSGFWENIASYPTISVFNHKMIEIDSLIRSHVDIYKYINNNNSLLSIHKTGKNQIDALFVISSANRFDASRIKSLVKSDKKNKFIEYTFRNNTIYSLQGAETDIKLAFAFCGGLFIMSKNSGLVEDAIRSVYENKNPVKKLIRTNRANSKNDKFHINFAEFPSLLNILLNNKGNLAIKDLRHFASNVEFDFDFTEEELILRGNLPFNDSSSYFVNLFENQSPRTIDIDKVASVRTAVLILNNVSDYPAYFEKINNRKNQSGNNKDITDKIRKELVSKINGQFAITLSEPVLEDLSKSQCIWIKTEEAEDLKNYFYDNTSALQAGNFNDRMYYPTSKTHLLPLLLGELYKINGDAWFTVIRDYIVFSSNINLLQSNTEDFLNEQTLSKSSDFLKIIDKMSSETNYLFYANPTKALKLPEYYLNEIWLNKYKSQNFLLSIGQIAFQMTNNLNSMYAEMIVQQNKTTISGFQKVWEFELDTSAISKPFMVINHNNNHSELLIMDELNNLYLITAEGELLWKKNIGSPLVGDITMIDFYNNKKYQFLFATESHLHCIDRLGRNVANYPIRLGSKAVSGIYLHKSGPGKQLKYFIGTSNQAVYGYDISGKPLNGWSLIRVDHNLASSPSAVMAGSKEYIYAVTQNGTLYMWDIKGKVVVNALVTGSGFKNSFYPHHGIDQNDSYIISLDSNGNTWKIYVNGKKEIQQLSKWTSDTWFLFTDINSDKKYEQVYFDKNTISFYEENSKVINSFEVRDRSGEKPQIICLNNNCLLAFYNTDNSNLYCYNLTGIPVRNFPVKISKYYSFYDLNGDNEIDLTGTNGRKIFVARF